MGSELLVQGLVMLALGMGTVFVFLGLLVLLTAWMTALVHRYLPAQSPVPGSDPPAQPADAGPDPSLLAAISAALHQHRGKRDD